MDTNVRGVRNDRLAPASLLCAEGEYHELLGLGYEGNRFFPVETEFYARKSSPTSRVSGLHAVFSPVDGRMRKVVDYFDNREWSYSSVDEFGDFYFRAMRPPRMPMTPVDARFRQEGVKALVENDSLYTATEQALCQVVGVRKLPKGFDAVIDARPEALREKVETLERVVEIESTAGPFARLNDWLHTVHNDQVYQEHFREKRKVTDSRIFLGVTEQYSGTTLFMLNEGIELSDVATPVSSEMTSYLRLGRDSREKDEMRSIIKEKSQGELFAADNLMLEVRQRMDVLNELSAGYSGTAFTLTMLQLQNLFLGATLYRDWQASGYEVTFPEISDDRLDCNLQNIRPIGLMFAHNMNENSSENGFKPIDISLTHQLTHIQGPNNRGKSQAWDTVHYAALFAAYGWPLPAASGKIGVHTGSHYLSFCGDRHFGGSELVHAKNELLRAFESVRPGDQVIIDEVGNSTNAPTANEIADRILPELLSRGGRVLTTSHHGSLDKKIEQYGGVTRTTSEGYQLVPVTGSINYMAGEVLDNIGWTQSKVRQALSSQANTMSSPVNQSMDQRGSRGEMIEEFGLTDDERLGGLDPDGDDIPF